MTRIATGAALAGVVLMVCLSAFADDTGCMEDNRPITFAYFCDKDPKTCPQDDTLSTTIELGVEAGAIVTGFSGGVSFTYNIGGCDPAYLPADMRYESRCDRESGSQFTSGSYSGVTKLREKSCVNTFDVYSCKATTVMKEFTLPNAVIDALNNMVPGADPFAYGLKFPLPTIKCVADAKLQSPVCNGGDKTYKTVADNTCFQND